MCNMREEEFKKMLERGYMTDEEFAEIERDAEEAWEKYEASRAEDDEDECMLTGGIGSMSH
ncbi:unnamed protein product [marine sediment metagenome]|uniref:Uncharacterized protein n=2 Tax=marine sediment metagenome TaxID=412755 RepID=X1F7A8_9ZZZZ